MGRISDHDRKRNKRLILSTPVGLIVILIILISLESSQVVEKIFLVGYEGPLELIPEITIIDEKGIESEYTSKERHAMVAQNVEIESERREESKNPEEITSKEPEKTPERQLPEDIAGRDIFRSYQQHADVPYVEDYIILKIVEPVYPPEALELGLEGYVVVEAYVNEQGKVAEAWIRSSYGPESFEAASIEAILQFLFKPTKERGKAVPFWISFLIRFKCHH